VPASRAPICHERATTFSNYKITLCSTVADATRPVHGELRPGAVSSAAEAVSAAHSGGTNATFTGSPLPTTQTETRRRHRVTIEQIFADLTDGAAGSPARCSLAKQSPVTPPRSPRCPRPGGCWTRSPRAGCGRQAGIASAVTANVGRVGHAALGLGRPQRCWRSLRMRARSRRWAARTAGWRALALRQLR